jgi:hypothetical protein
MVTAQCWLDLIVCVWCCATITVTLCEFCTLLLLPQRHVTAHGPGVDVPPCAALIVYMAQIGSFVPAAYAEIGVVDAYVLRGTAASDSRVLPCLTHTHKYCDSHSHSACWLLCKACGSCDSNCCCCRIFARISSTETYVTGTRFRAALRDVTVSQ